MKIKLLAIALLLSVISFAQKTLKGKIIDAISNTPLSGATISFIGKGGTTTDKEGNFSVDCNKVKAFTVSFIGYESYKMNIKNCEEGLTIKLERSASYLEEVEISATSSNNKNILYQPASISKLSPLELKRGTGLFLDDAIQTNITGVIMNRRTIGGGQQFNIRGYGNGTRGTRGPSSNFDGQGYKVYLNGIPVTDAEGITTLDDIDFGSIGNVEITKGPAGTLYGLAIAGAVNLSTIKPVKGKTSVGQEVMLGSYGLQRYNSNFQTTGERSSWLVNYGHQKMDGVSWHNKSKKDFVNAIGEFNPNENQNITTYFGYSNSYDERFGELTIDQWNNNDYSGNPDYLKRNAHSNVITFRAGVGHTYNFRKNISNTTTVFGTGFTSNVSSAAGWTDKNTINYGLRSTFNTKFILAEGINLNGLTGIETQRQDAQVIGYSMKANPNDPNPVTYVHGTSPYWVINTTTSNTAFISKTTSLFTEWTLALPKDFSVTAGIGVSNMNLSLNDRFVSATATRPAQFYKNYTGMVSPHVAINKVFSKEVSVYAAYSKGYKAPVSSYFFIPVPSSPASARVNNDLKAEIANQFEVGTKGQLLKDKLVYELAYFHAVFFNKMTTVGVLINNNTTGYNYVVNGKKQIHNGVEALVKYTAYNSSNTFIQTIRPFANLTYSDFKYENGFTFQTITKTVNTPVKDSVATSDFSNKKVAAVPQWIANLGVDVTMKHGLYFNLTWNYKDKLPINSINTLYAGSYQLLNGKLGIRHDLGKHFNLDAYVGGTNLTNTKYYYMVFANQLPDAYLPAARHSLLFGGVNLKYTF
ncbi:MAG: TonB-dependent receptor [Sphingobacteriales bacterium]|nr:TonB-dependent receptor [Sphingobacteriales bacterium]